MQEMGTESKLSHMQSHDKQKWSMVDDESIENVENFIFLGSVVPEISDDMNQKIAFALTAFARLKKNIFMFWSFP